jgi:alkylation response protein AidB-like acyl-CoA dehydrogenase
MLVFASHRGAPEHAGISAFLVDKGTPGFTVSRHPGKTRHEASPLCEVVLTDCLIPSGKRLGQEGAGMDIFNSSMELERSCTLASALGDMQRQLETCVGYAQAQKQFGQAIGKFQNVADRLADMYLRLEAARLLVYQAAWLSQQGKLASAEAAAAKLFTSEAWVQSSLDSIQIHGGYGYSQEAGIRRELRDAIASTGAAGIQRDALSRMLGLRVGVYRGRPVRSTAPGQLGVLGGDHEEDAGHRGGTSSGGSDQRLCQPELRESGPLPLANAAPRLMKTGVLESPSLGGSRG